MEVLNQPRRGDFGMTRLQKSSKQQQRRSQQSRNDVAKLTPSEIRILNNNITASNEINTTVSRSSHHSSIHTPPLSPDEAIHTWHSRSRGNSATLPTPPQSPGNQEFVRQNLGSTMYIHSPVPQSYNKAGFVAANNSRPQSASSQNGMPTYRGPEVTKPGAFSMLQSSSTLSHQIVDNPLSQFSRPRQSRGSVSPTRENQKRKVTSGQLKNRSQRSLSLPATNSSPIVPVNAPFPDISDRTISKNAAAIIEAPQLPTSTGSSSDKPRITASAGQNSRFSWQWRRSMNVHHGDNESTKIKKARRRTIALAKGSSEIPRAIAYETTVPRTPPELRQTLKDELPSRRFSMNEQQILNPPANTTGFTPHPAVRPLSSQSETRPNLRANAMMECDDEQEHSHNVLGGDPAPVYSRCSCCGKLKKPVGSRSLSPVLENDNIRTNFAMEIERTTESRASKRRSSSVSRQRYTPIIPMSTGEGNTVQARIEPNPGEDWRQQQQQQQPESLIDADLDLYEELEPVPVINDNGDLIATGSEPIALIPKVLEDAGKRLSRFQSLRVSRSSHQLSRSQINNMGEKHSSSSQVSRRGMSPENEGPAYVTVSPTHDPALLQEDSKTIRQGPTETPSARIASSNISSNNVMVATDENGGSSRRLDYGPEHLVHWHELDPGHKQGSIPSRHSNQERSTREDGPTLVDSYTLQRQLQSSDAIAHTVQDKTISDQDLTASVHPPRSKYAKSSSGQPRTYRKSSSRGLSGTSTEGEQSMTPNQTYNQMCTIHHPMTKDTSHGINAISMPENHGVAQNIATGADVVSGRPTVYRDPENQNPNHTSAGYSPLPIPQFGQDFGDSNHFLKGYTLPRSKVNSNLVESVLAATNSRTNPNDYMRAFEN